MTQKQKPDEKDSTEVQKTENIHKDQPKTAVEEGLQGRLGEAIPKCHSLHICAPRMR